MIEGKQSPKRATARPKGWARRAWALIAGLGACAGVVWGLIENSTKITEFVVSKSPAFLVERLGLAPEPAGVDDLPTLIENRFAADDLYSKTMGAPVVDRVLRMQEDPVDRRYRIYRNHLGILLTIQTGNDKTATLYLPSTINKYVKGILKHWSLNEKLIYFDPRTDAHRNSIYMFDSRFDNLSAMIVFVSAWAPDYAMLYLATHKLEFICPMGKETRRMRLVSDGDCAIHDGFRTEPFPLSVKPLIGRIFDPQSIELRSFPGGLREWLPIVGDSLGEMFSQEIARQLAQPPK